MRWVGTHLFLNYCRIQAYCIFCCLKESKKVTQYLVFNYFSFFFIYGNDQLTAIKLSRLD